MVIVSTFLLSLFVAMAVIPVCRRAALAAGVVDTPSPRKVHEHPTPRTGGIGMAIGAVIALGLWAEPSRFLTALAAGAGVVLIFGLVDDIRELGYRAKFLGQSSAAVVIVAYGGVRVESLGALLPEGAVLPPWLSIPLTLVAILGVTNAINFSDGLDGLAGGISVLSLGCIGFLGYQAEMPTVALVAAAVAGAVFAFLRFNSHPATVFMGDAGSQLLGFVTIVLALHLTQTNEPLSPTLPLVILGLPVLDALVVTSERIARGRSPFLADRNHLHHKLIKLGVYHADAVRLIYVLQAGLITTAYLLRYHSDWLLLGGCVACSGLVVGGLKLSESTGWRIRRYAPVVARAKARIQRARETGLLVKLAFRLLVAGLLAVMVASCLVPGQLPRWTGVPAIGLLILLGYGSNTGKNWVREGIRLSLFALVALLVYEAETGGAPWVGHEVMQAYNASVAGLVLLALIVVKLTRRRWFRSTPLDLLILFVAVVLPYLGQDPQHMGTIIAKVLALFFVLEVFLAELREEQRWSKVGVVALLVIVAVRGVAG